MKKIVLTGGGTAGHIYPALALVDYLEDHEVYFIGSSGMEKDIVSRYKNIKFHEIPSVKLVRKLTLKNLLVPFKLFRSIRFAKKVLKEISPDIIFSKGGFVSVPVVFAGKKLNIPAISHESDLSMGLANKLILKKCDVMCTTFLQTSKLSPKCVFTGQPIRKDLLNPKFLGIKQYFQNSKPLVLVVGGSLGSKFINEKIWENLEDLTKICNVIHITGNHNKKDAQSEGYSQIEFSNEMGSLYSEADLVISRSGSGVINELLFFKKPMLLIPLSKKCSRGDQIENAKLFKKLGYCEMIEEEDFSSDLFFKKIDTLLNEKQKYIIKMQSSHQPLATKKIVELIKKHEKV